MTDFDKVWGELQEQLKDGYLDADGSSVASCYLVAKKIALALRSDLRDPKIFTVHGQDVQGEGWSHRELLVPTPYEGRVTWSAHLVCVEQDIAYDPILSAPEPLATYPERAFGIQTVEMYPSRFELK